MWQVDLQRLVRFTVAVMVKSFRHLDCQRWPVAPRWGSRDLQSGESACTEMRVVK